MSAINGVANKHGFRVVEDVAQAHGATIGGAKVGTLSDIAAFSFYPTKNLGAYGDGGAVVTRDQALADHVRRLRVYGAEKQYVSVEEGVNSRLDELQAAFLSTALPRLDAANKRRKEIAERYRSGITNPAISLPSQSHDGREGVWHLFVIQIDGRERFIEHMKESGVACAVHYPKPIYRQEAYAFLSVDPAEYPVTERIASRIVSLPLFPELSDAEIDEVIAAANAYSTR